MKNILSSLNAVKVVYFIHHQLLRCATSVPLCLEVQSPFSPCLSPSHVDLLPNVVVLCRPANEFHSELGMACEYRKLLQ